VFPLEGLDSLVLTVMALKAQQGLEANTSRVFRAAGREPAPR